MILSEMFCGTDIIFSNVDMLAVVALPKFDSRKIEKSDVFFCFNGKNNNGFDFLAQAITRGCACIVTSEKLDEALPQIVVGCTRAAFALCCGNHFDNPIRKMKLVTVVGTNGKTTTAFLLAEILKLQGIKTGLISTIYNEIADKKFVAEMTTPDPFELHQLFWQMNKEGVEVVVIEHSAHAIHHSKLCGVVADFSIFTNISQDHLDFFGDLESYAKTKTDYFVAQNTRFAVVNTDDKWGAKIIENCDCKKLSYGLKCPSDIFAIDINYRISGTDFVVNICDEVSKINTRLFGAFNVYNTIAAMTVARLLGVKISEIARAIKTVRRPDGRFNSLTKKGATFIVDFAHTPDGLDNLLGEARKVCHKKLVAVFGCGGERDTLKRAIMGEVAAKHADIIVLTADNSRSERTEDIMAMIQLGIPFGTKVVQIAKRAQAIKYAYDIAEVGDFIIIAGKGAEEFIEIDGQRIEFNDLKFVNNLDN